MAGPSRERGSPQPRLPAFAWAAATSVVAVVVVAWIAGWCKPPGVVPSGFEPPTSGDDVRWFEGRGDLRVHGEWRPVDVAFTLVPPVGQQNASREVTVEVEGEPRRVVSVSANHHVEVTLPRLRGLADAAGVVLRTEPPGRMGVREVEGSYRFEWSVWLTALYAGLVGAWLGARAATVPRLGSSWPRSTDSRVALALQLFLLAMAVMVVRKPDAVWVPQLWAEDGAVFLRDAYLRGVDAFVTPYSGYLHLVPRIVAAAAAAAARTAAPLCFVAGALVPVFLIAWLISSPRLLLAPAERVGAVLLVALPPMPGEVLLNLTNTPWMFGFVLVLVLLAPPPATLASTVAESAMLTVGALTGPVSLALAPIFAVHALWRPSPAAIRRTAIVLACAAVQATILSSSGRLEAGEGIPADVLLAQLAQRLAAHVSLSLSEDAGFLLAIAIGGGVLLGLAVMVVERVWPAVVCVSAGLLVYAASFAGVQSISTGFVAGGERYHSLPLGLLLWGVLLARRTHPRLASVVLGGALLLASSSLLVPPAPDLRWAEASACLERDDACRVPLNPAGWSLDMPPKAER
jgi:hypothetical protein